MAPNLGLEGNPKHPFIVLHCATIHAPIPDISHVILVINIIIAAMLFGPTQVTEGFHKHVTIRVFHVRLS